MRAGVECGDCAVPCGSAAYCWPTITPEQAEIQLPPESSAQVIFRVEAVSGAGPSMPCEVSFEAAEPWMAVEAAQIDWMTWELTVTVNTAGLASGAYRGWIRSTTWCTACAAIDLTVTEMAAVEEERPQSTSWGRIKDGFRR